MLLWVHIFLTQYTRAPDVNLHIWQITINYFQELLILDDQGLKDI